MCQKEDGGNDDEMEVRELQKKMKIQTAEKTWSELAFKGWVKRKEREGKKKRKESRQMMVVEMSKRE